ncbi:Cytochrome c551 peroxidase [hydrothermal vent metagenome]|uniref:Cytochrome c551 peroxidase n=1 Tax=hydrothermal vent metagenome TaxID=652676 RepID=A0A3B0W8T3_9ZZZZ
MWTPVLFTDFQYYNLGLPRNTEFPFKALGSGGGSDPIIIFPGSGGGSGGNTGDDSQWSQNPALSQVDLGLDGVLDIRSERGRFKVPTLRNVELTAPYMHNGVLKTLKEVVQFYNLRNTGAWGVPEVGENVEQRRVGNLGLSSAQEDAIVAFLLTLTDGYVADNNSGGYGQGHKKNHHKKHSKKRKHDGDKKYSKKRKHDDHKKYSNKESLL